MLVIKNLWFTLKCLARSPERTFSYIVNRSGNSHKNLLIFTTILVSWINKLLLTQPDNRLSFLLWSCFLLPITFFVAVYTFKFGASILVFLLEKFGDSMETFSAELIIVYSFLPISILYALLSIPLNFFGTHDSPSITFDSGILICEAILLFRAIYSLTNLSWNRSFYTTVIFTVLPCLLLGTLTLFMPKAWL